MGCHSLCCVSSEYARFGGQWVGAVFRKKRIHGGGEVGGLVFRTIGTWAGMCKTRYYCARFA